jgi:hypothetical protein
MLFQYGETTKTVKCLSCEICEVSALGHSSRTLLSQDATIWPNFLEAVEGSCAVSPNCNPCDRVQL